MTLPSTLTTLKAFAFQCDTLIDAIILNSVVPPSTLGDSVFTCFAATLIVPCGTAAAYRQHEVWNLFANIIEDCNAIDEPGSADDPICITVRDGRIVVEGAEGEPVRIYDMMGRPMANRTLPTGIYMVKVGNRPAQKITVIR